MEWRYRPFLDWYVKHPTRFEFKNPTSGVIEDTYDLDFVPRQIRDIGTPANRGYWDEIEKFLTYASTRVKEIVNTQHLYAKKDSQKFTNPKAVNTSFDGTAPLSAVTTNDVRQYIMSFPFPPKNVTNLLSTNVSVVNYNLTWTEPIDFVYDNMLLSKWVGTKIVYRTDRYPNSPYDGKLLAEFTTRNNGNSFLVETQKLETAFKYYIQLFPYSDQNVYNININNRVPEIIFQGMQILAPLSVGRERLSAAKDGNGKVLFAGGTYYNASYVSVNSDDVDIYDINGLHNILSPMSQKRQALSSATDSNGNAVFAGGFPNINTSEIYSISGAHTVEVLNTGRSYHASATDGNGDVLIGGGRIGATAAAVTNTVEKRTSAGVYINLSPLNSARSSLTASTDVNGNVLFMGGQDANSNEIAIVDKYTAAGLHTVLTPLSMALSGAVSTTNSDGNVVVGTGLESSGRSSVVNVYDVNGNRVRTGNLKYGCSGSVATTAKFGAALFTGGQSSTVKLNTTQIYSNSGVVSVNEYMNLSLARWMHAGSADGNGNILFGGGVDINNVQTDSVERLVYG